MAEDVKEYALKKGIDLAELVIGVTFVGAVCVAAFLAIAGGTLMAVIATI